MEFYSKQFRFEEAMQIRNRIQTISKYEIKSTLDFAKDEDLDLFQVEMGIKRAVIVRMFIRNGKLISSTHSFINITDITSKEDIYKTALINYYSGDLPSIVPIVVVEDILEAKDELETFIQSKFQKKISIIVPKIGIKKDLIMIEKNNCQELLKIDTLNESKNIYFELKNLFQLDTVPTRFECYDNSQMMGQAKVGAMIVWENDMFYKDDYRLYNLEANDEYGQMKEMLTRRVNKFDINPAPDLWVIDGGATLLKLAYDITNSIGINLDIIAIAKEKIDAKAHRAKGSAKDIIYTKDNIFKLETSDKRLQFIQRLRDESHRSAIGFHKKQKRKEDKQISLLNIYGIGEAKIKKLLNYFGTFELIKSASLAQLKQVLNDKDSLKVFEYFQLDK
jgi:excinuclease ABC subunit C